MAVSKSAANAGRKTHQSLPSSKLSGQKFITKPENRVGVKVGSVTSAEKLVNGLGSGK